MSTTIISTTTKKYQDIVVGASSMAENAPNTIANTFVPSASINAKRKASTEISDVATKKQHSEAAEEQEDQYICPCGAGCSEYDNDEDLCANGCCRSCGGDDFESSGALPSC